MLKNVLKTLVGYSLLVLGATGFFFTLWAFFDPKMSQASNDSNPFGVVVNAYVAIEYSVIYAVIAVLGWLILRAKRMREQ